VHAGEEVGRAHLGLEQLMWVLHAGFARQSQKGQSTALKVLQCVQVLQSCCTFELLCWLPCAGCAVLQWAPFCEFVYQRPESSSKGQQEHTEHSVVFLVDAWTLSTHNPDAEAQLQVCTTARMCAIVCAAAARHVLMASWWLSRDMLRMYRHLHAACAAFN